jgi:transposase
MRPKAIDLAKHLGVEELAQRYKSATDAKEVRRWQALWLIGQGRSISEMARIVGMHRYTVRDILKRYNERGAEETLDRRGRNAGQPPRLDPEQQGRLREALRVPAPDGGLWTGPKVAEWIAHETARPAPKKLGYQYLKRIGARLVAPRRRHTKAATEEEQEAWQAAFSRYLEGERLRALLVGAQLEVWAQDEARLGPETRRAARVGRRL